MERFGLQLQAIALTHAHLDHVGGVAALKKLKPEAKISLHKGDEFMYQALPEQPAWIGIPRAQWAALGFAFEQPPQVDHYWTDGEKYYCRRARVRSASLSGTHTGPRRVLRTKRKERVCWRCVVCRLDWRTDLPGGSTEQLLNSIKNKLLTLDDDVKVYSGHGPVTTIGEERFTNPFLVNRYV